MFPLPKKKQDNNSCNEKDNPSNWSKILSWIHGHARSKIKPKISCSTLECMYVPVIRVSLWRDRKRLGADVAGRIWFLDQTHCVRDRARTPRSQEYQSRSVSTVRSRNRTVHHRSMFPVREYGMFQRRKGHDILKRYTEEEEGCRRLRAKGVRGHQIYLLQF